VALALWGFRRSLGTESVFAPAGTRRAEATPAGTPS